MMSRRHPWLLVALLWVLALLNYVDRQVLFSVFPLLGSDLRLTGVELGLLSAAFLWTYGLLSPMAGYVADRFGRGRTIAFSVLVWSAVTLLTGLSRNMTQLLASRALMGVSEACYLPAALAKIAEEHGPRTRSLAVGLHQSGLYAGIVLGGIGGGWAGQRFGWRAPFLALGGFGLLYFVVISRFFRVTAPEAGKARPAAAPSVGETWHALAGVPGFAAMTAAFCGTAIANWLVYTWLPLYLYERFHMSLAQAGFTATFYIQASSFAGILLGGYLADRWSAISPRGRLYTQVAGMLLAGPFLFLLGNAGSWPVLVTALVLFGAGRGFYDSNTMPVLCQVAPNHLRSTGYGVFNFAGCIAGGMVAALAGAGKASLGLAPAFRIAAGILVLSGAVLLTIRGKLVSEPRP
jgi:MFS family permease